MKKHSRGFTLAELLLCVGIIGIVSAMGMTVAKIGTDRAYNLYFYTGYINLYNAIADAKANGVNTNSGIMSHVSSLLGSTNVSDNNTVIETANSIRYFYSNPLADGLNGVVINAEDNEDVDDVNAFPITMTVPQRQTRTNNGIATVHLLYIDLNGGYLIPVSGDGVVDLQNRRDLLPTYIDDGKVGRNNVINSNNWNYKRPAYRSYREAYCLLSGRTVINNIISCDGISASQTGVLAFTNPQKAR